MRPASVHTHVSSRSRSWDTAVGKCFNRTQGEALSTCGQTGSVMIVHGQTISAEDVERIVSREFDARRFASLCNAIAWGTAGRRCSSLPAFTERVNVVDGGIDAEWDVEMPGDHAYQSPLLGPGWNVF